MAGIEDRLLKEVTQIKHQFPDLNLVKEAFLLSNNLPLLSLVSATLSSEKVDLLMNQITGNQDLNSEVFKELREAVEECKGLFGNVGEMEQKINMLSGVCTTLPTQVELIAVQVEQFKEVTRSYRDATTSYARTADSLHQQVAGLADKAFVEAQVMVLTDRLTRMDEQVSVFANRIGSRDSAQPTGFCGELDVLSRTVAELNKLSRAHSERMQLFSERIGTHDHGQPTGFCADIDALNQSVSRLRTDTHTRLVELDAKVGQHVSAKTFLIGSGISAFMVVLAFAGLLLGPIQSHLFGVSTRLAEIEAHLGITGKAHTGEQH